VIEGLAGAGLPAGRLEDLRKAFGAPPGTGVRLPVRGAIPTPIIGAASQQTRTVQSPFKAPFDAGQAQPQSPQPPAPAPAPPSAKHTIVAGPMAVPHAPLPLRGKAAEILKTGMAAAMPPIAPPPPPEPPDPEQPPAPHVTRASAPAGRTGETFFGGGKLTAEAVRATAAGRPTILLADDDKRIRMVFRIKLEEKGYNVVEAADGQEAWKRLEAGGFSAAVLDMKMPGLHGLEILSRLADSGQALPVVICTAYDRLDDEFVVATYPKLRYLTKPVDAAHLAETLTNLLAEQ
jgi:CheY-like chemotaxis protein